MRRGNAKNHHFGDLIEKMRKIFGKIRKFKTLYLGFMITDFDEPKTVPLRIEYEFYIETKMFVLFIAIHQKKGPTFMDYIWKEPDGMCLTTA